MANSISHASLPYPVKGARYTILVPYLDADGDPTDPTTPDTERSIDGAAFADCTEEVTTISGSNGAGYITLTGDETNCSLLAVVAKVASGPKATILPPVKPRLLPVVHSGTAAAGAAGSITLGTGSAAIDDFYNGCIVKTTAGTGAAGGSGSLGNQARIITDYNGSTKVATVVPNWETTPDNTTTYEVQQTEFCVSNFADVKAWLGTAAATPTTAGVPEVDVTHLGGASQSATDLKDFADTGYDPVNHWASAKLAASASHAGASVAIAGAVTIGQGMTIAGASNDGAAGLTITGGGSEVGGPGVSIIGGAGSNGDGGDAIKITGGTASGANDDGSGLVISYGNDGTGTAADIILTNSDMPTFVEAFFSNNPASDYATAAAGSLVKEIADNAGGASLTEAGIADAVWDELASGHTTNGTYGKAFTGATAVYLASGIAGTINTLDALDTAQDSQHSTTQSLVTTVDTVVDAIAAVLTGITSLAQWLGLIAGKQTGNSTARTELRATGAGSGTYDETTDSLEANRDNIGTAGAGLTAADDAVITAIGALSIPSAATIADAVWDEDATAHQTQGTFGQAIGDPGSDSDTIWALVNTNLDAAVSTRSTVTTAQVNTEVDTALADVGLTTTVTGRIDVAISTRLATASYTAPLDAAGTRAAVGLASANLDTQISTLATAANLATVAGYLDTEIAAILADTNELQTDWANGGRLDLILDARASQTSVDDLPTNAELATALASADDATLAAIAALSIPTAVQNADALLGRNIAGGSSTGRTVSQALYVLRNRVTRDTGSGTLTVYQTDDTTTSWTAVQTTSGSAEPIVEVNPA